MSSTLAAFAVLAWLAYLASRVLARRHLPELVAFLIVGAVLGPSGVELISDNELLSLRPITEVALAVLMFVIGERVSGRALRAAKWTVSAGVVQFALSAVAVFFATRAVGSDRSVALLLAALAGAGAPMTIVLPEMATEEPKRSAMPGALGDPRMLRPPSARGPNSMRP